MQIPMVLLTFSVFDLQVLSKKSFWHFDVTSSIFQQVTRRDLKLVAFLLMAHLWHIMIYQASFYPQLHVVWQIYLIMYLFHFGLIINVNVLEFINQRDRYLLFCFKTTKSFNKLERYYGNMLKSFFHAI